jgi:uncharacterized SAM-binding protein YcdF (DUF218 family)
MPFQLKKFISQFLMPMPLVCECLLLGWVLTRFTKYKKTGKVFYLLAFTLFLAFGYGFGRTYLHNLERRYPAFDPTPEQCEALRGMPIVVLGQWMPAKSDLPVRYQNNPVFERRLFEGIRVAKLIPDSRLIVSMAGDASNNVKQAALDYFMQQFNFPTNRVTMFTTARDTEEEAKLANARIRECANARMLECANARMRECANGVSSIKFPVSNLSTNAFEHSRTRALPAEAPIPEFEHSSTRALSSSSEFTNSRTRALPAEAPIPEFEHSSTRALVLATSASHIPRAMKIFQKQGLNPIASPCDYTDFDKPECERTFWYRWPLPSGTNFDTSQRALYEWLGNCYEWIF